MRAKIGWLVAASGAGHVVLAAEVRVTGPGGAPVAGAEVRCLQPPATATTTGADGTVLVDASCLEVRCSAADLVPAEARVEEGTVRCRLSKGVIVTGNLRGAACATETECLAVLHPRSDTPIETDLHLAGAPPAPSFIFPALLPGRYTLELRRRADGWSCRSDLGPLDAGRVSVLVPWREPARLAGKVVLPDSSPVRSVQVRTWPEHRDGQDATLGTWRCGGDDGVEAATDDGGRFALGRIDPASPRLLVAGDWKHPAGLAAVLLDALPEASPTLVLERSVRVRASVLDEEDRPVTCDARLEPADPLDARLRARLEGSNAQVPCDERGGLELGPFRSSSFRVHVEPRAGQRILRSEPAPAAGAVVDLGVLRVLRGEMLRVRVRDEAGAPIEGARVNVFQRGAVQLSHEQETDEGGWAELAGFSAGVLLNAGISAEGFSPKSVADVSASDGPLEVTLEAGARISGSVVDEQGEGVAGAHVYVKKVGDDRNSASTRSDDAGAYHLDGVPPGSGKLEALADGYGQSDQVPVTVAAGQSISRDLELGPGLRLEGRVVDAGGTPVAGARAMLVRTAWDWFGSSPYSEALSDSGGRFGLEQTPWQRQILLVRAAGQGHGVRRLPISREEVTVALPAESRLVVHVPAERGGARAVRVRDGAEVGVEAPIVEGSSVRFDGLAPGRGEVWLHSRAGVDAQTRKSVELLPGSTIEVTLDAGAAIEGTVTLEGRPMPIAIVTTARENQILGTQFADDRGRYRFEGLSPGPVRLVADVADGKAVRDVTVPSGGRLVVDLDAKRVVLEARVLDSESGAPIQKGEISVVPASQANWDCRGYGTGGWAGDGYPDFFVMVYDRPCGGALIGESGLARVSLAEPGAYRVLVQRMGYKEDARQIELAQGVTRLEVRLDPKPPAEEPDTAVPLRVFVDVPPEARRGWLVCRGTGKNTRGLPASRQAVDCGPIKPGPVEIQFRSPGWGSAWMRVEIPEDSEPVELTLGVPRGGTLLVPVESREVPWPKVIDRQGVNWADILTRVAQNDVPSPDRRMIPDVGLCWEFGDLPPGTYTAVVGGASRTAVEVRAGQISTAW